MNTKKIIYLNKIGLQNCRNTHEVSVPVLQKHARSKCAGFAPLLRAGFRKTRTK
jgi:hypothetical protein